MPHIQIDYGAGLEATVDIQGLVDVVHQAAVDSGVFPLWGIRTFAQAMPCYRIGNGHPANAFVHISVRIAPGRSPEVRQRVANAMLAAALVPLGPLYAERPVGCQVDVSEFDPVACVYQNSLDDAVQAAPSLQSRRSAGAPL